MENRDEDETIRPLLSSVASDNDIARTLLRQSFAATATTRCMTCRDFAYVTPEGRRLELLSFQERVRILEHFVEVLPKVMRPVQLPAGGGAFAVDARHRPLYPPLRQWQLSASHGCQNCKLIIDAIREMRPAWLRQPDNKYVGTAAIPGLPLQVTLTDVTKSLSDERENALEIFCQPRERDTRPVFGPLSAKPALRMLCTVDIQRY